MSSEMDYLGEGPTDEAIARKLIQAVRGLPGNARRTPLSGSGKSSLDRRLKGINAGLHHNARSILVLRDLDTDAPCPPELLAKLLPDRHANMLLRLCVREAEAWLLADADAYAYAEYCGVKTSKIPQDLDRTEYPKQLILAWKAKNLNRHFLDARRRGVPDWAALATWNLAFIEERWNALRAAKQGRSNSLCRTVARLQKFTTR